MAITKISPSVVDFDAGITISTADNLTQLTLSSTDADENSGPQLALTRDSGSPADDDFTGLISFNADDDAGNSTRFAMIRSQIKDASNGAEDGLLDFKVMNAGTERSVLQLNGGGTVIVNQDSQDFDFRVESNDSANALFVQGSDGNIGMGDGSPSNALVINRASSAAAYAVVGNGGNVQSYIGVAGDNLPVLGSLTNHDLRLVTNAAEKMRITSAGQVGIGTSSPGNSILYVAGDSASNWTYHLKNTQTSGSTWGQYIQYAGTAPDDNNSQFFHCGDTGSARFIVYGDGDAWTADAGTLSSDRTLKTNIQDATPKLADVMKLKVRNFEWDETFRPAKKGKKHIGFIAQEFEEVFPALVSEHDIAGGDPTEEDHTPIIKKALKEAKLIPILVKAIQEQQALIETLQTKVKVLEEA